MAQCNPSDVNWLKGNRRKGDLRVSFAEWEQTGVTTGNKGSDKCRDIHRCGGPSVRGSELPPWLRAAGALSPSV